MAYAAGVSQDQAPSTGKHRGYNIPAPRHGPGWGRWFYQTHTGRHKEARVLWRHHLRDWDCREESKMCMWATMRLVEC